MALNSNRDGQALILALVMVALSAGMCGLTALAIRVQDELVNDRTTDLRLMALDDAALAMTVARLSISAGHRGIVEQAFGGGRIASQADLVGQDRVVVTTNVKYRSRVRRSRSQVLLRVPHPVVTSWTPLAPLGDPEE